jgi:hypothetical protein
MDISEGLALAGCPRRRKPPSQSWRAFLENHVGVLVSMHFFTVPTAKLRVLFVLIVLAHDRRKIVHFDVTQPRSGYRSRWWKHFCDGEVPRFRIHDRDGVYAAVANVSADRCENAIGDEVDGPGSWMLATVGRCWSYRIAPWKNHGD